MLTQTPRTAQLELAVHKLSTARCRTAHELLKVRRALRRFQEALHRELERLGPVTCTECRAPWSLPGHWEPGIDGLEPDEWAEMRHDSVCPCCRTEMRL